MLLKNHFSLALSPDEVFAKLLDLERVASCMPGAKLSGSTGNDYQGTIRLKVGPIRASYEGTVSVEETDPRARRAILQANGRELDGHGSAEARIQASVLGDGDGSRVEIETDLNIQGRAAQFGRGVLGEVTQRVIEQFAQNLEGDLLEPDAPAPKGASIGVPGGTPERPPADDSLDAWRVVVLPQIKKTMPQLVAAAIGMVIGILIGRSLRSGTRMSDTSVQANRTSACQESQA